MKDVKSIKNEPKGCGKYVGKAFDNDNMKVYCGDEIYGGEKRGLFIKLCPDCKRLNEQAPSSLFTSKVVKGSKK